MTLSDGVLVSLIFAAITTTSFPILYSFSPWYKSHLGRAFMAQAIAFSVAIDLTLLFKFWLPKDLDSKLMITIAAFMLVGIASLGLTAMMYRMNYVRFRATKENAMSFAEPAMSEESPVTPILSNKRYDQLKYITTIALPAIATLYFTVSQIWNLPRGTEVVGTITALVTFMGLLLRLSSKTYNSSEAKYDGAVNVSKTDGVTTFELDVFSDLDKLDQKSEIVMKVVPKHSAGI